MNNPASFVLAAVLSSTLGAQGYVVLDGVGADDPFYAAAKLLAEHRTGRIVRFDASDLEPCRAVLRECRPEYVAIVVRPEQIDFDFARRFLQMATEVDEDPFVDFSYGFITAATADEAAELVRRSIAADAKPRAAKLGKLIGGGGERSTEASYKYVLRRSRVDCVQAVVGNGAADAGAEHGNGGAGAGHDRAFVREFLPKLKDCSAVMFIGHGMPREVVGGADWQDLADLRLDGAVALNVACYTGVTGRYFEEDWSANVWRMKTIPPDESFALGVLRSGVVGYTAYTCPRPAGPELDTDLCALIAGGATLGEARRRDFDKTVLGFIGYGERRLDLVPVVDGAKLERSDDVVRGMMLEGATGGILFGDPALRPFRPRESDHPLTIGWKRHKERIAVAAACPPHAVFLQCADPTAKFGKTMAMKVHARVPLDGAFVRDVRVESIRFAGEEVDSRVVWAVEQDLGERYVQLKAMFPRPQRPGALDARIVVETTEDPAEASSIGGDIRRPKPVSSDLKSTVVRPFMLDIAERYRVGEPALQAALCATAAELGAGEVPPDRAREALAAFGSEGFRALCVLLEVGHHHYRTPDLLAVTYHAGDEAHLLALAGGDEELPRYASWSVLEGLGVADLADVREYLLERLDRETDAGLFMAAAKGLARLREPRAVTPVGRRILRFEPGFSGVEPHLLGVLSAIGGDDAARFLRDYAADERAKNAAIARRYLEQLGGDREHR